MPNPTHGQILHELTKEVATLNERVRALSEQINELKHGQEEASRKRWALLPPVLGAVAGAVVSSVLAALIAYFIAKK